MYFNEEMKPGMRVYLKRTLWAGLLQSAAAIVFGIFAFLSPIGTLSVFLMLIGFYLLVHGLLKAASSVMGMKSDSMWYIGVTSGLLQLLLGLFIVSRPGEASNTAVMLSTVGIGMVGIIAGTISLISAIRYRDIIANVWPFILRGGILFIIGVSMLLAPFGFGIAMVKVVGAVAVVLGLIQLWTSIRLFSELKD
jgi:uncharacterized membrane protein HdeD (DUF308 family)